jgi:CRISPR-associated protein Cas2
MPLCIVVTRDVEMRYRGFLGSVMLEVAPGFYVGPRITKGVRERIWSVMGDWHGQLQQGSITMAWREAGAPGGLRVQSLGGSRWWKSAARAHRFDRTRTSSWSCYSRRRACG